MARNTTQRKFILAAFEAADRPMGPNEVRSAALESAPALGIATVYRAIKDLLEEGWLTAVNLPGEATRYERAGKRHHHHFHCNRCKRVFEADGCSLSLKNLVPRGFKLMTHEIVLYGLCAGCCTGLEPPTTEP